MKKFIIFMILLFPFNIFAYSNNIIPGGQTIGIDVKSNGVMIVGFYKVNNKYNKNKLKVGDVITKINGVEVSTIEDLVNLTEKYVQNNKVNMTIKRSDEEKEIEFELDYINSTYKTGLYVKDGVTGIGTLSYIDPETRIYGALGHEIVDSSSGNLIEVKTGSIFKCSITSIERSVRGLAGTKNAKFYSNTKYGTIIKNTNKGIYGIYNSDISNLGTLEVGTYDDITLGDAIIRTVTSGEEVKEYQIMIDRLSNGTTKNIHFVVSDDNLIDISGGIVQGMSGSPIIQNNKIIGAVTHVIVDNPETGYGILITNMLEEGEKY